MAIACKISDIIKHLLDETESNIQFIASGQGNIGRSEAVCVFYYTEKIGSNKPVVWKRLVSTKVTVT